MHIEEKDSLEVYDFLRYERDRGMEWMLFGQENGKVSVAGIFCFATQDEMTGFRKQYPAFANGFKEALMETVVEAMAEKLEEGTELQPKTIDVKLPDENRHRNVLKLEKKSNGLLVKKQVDDHKHRQGHKVK